MNFMKDSIHRMLVLLTFLGGILFFTIPLFFPNEAPGSDMFFVMVITALYLPLLAIIIAINTWSLSEIAKQKKLTATKNMELVKWLSIASIILWVGTPIVLAFVVPYIIHFFRYGFFYY